jgi:methylated-DNA-[protein]-cysteine S-methyltransferase
MSNEGPQYSAIYLSALGPMRMTASEHGLLSLDFDAGENEASGANPVLEKCRKQLDEYFAGTRKIFELTYDLKGTDFQIQVWNELLNVPFGETVSYLHIANALGDPNSTRAVGNANGKNPIPVIIPCHRIIGSSGNLVGYSGGLHRKKWLLEFERNLTVPDLFNASLNEAAHE